MKCFVNCNKFKLIVSSGVEHLGTICGICQLHIKMFQECFNLTSKRALEINHIMYQVLIYLTCTLKPLMEHIQDKLDF